MNTVIAKFVISDDRNDFALSKDAKNLVVAFVADDGYFAPKLIKSALFRINKGGGNAALRVYHRPGLSDVTDVDWPVNTDVRQTDRSAHEIVQMPSFWASVSAFERVLILPTSVFIFRNPFALTGHLSTEDPDGPALYSVSEALEVAKESQGDFRARYTEKFPPEHPRAFQGGVAITNLSERSQIVRHHLTGVLM